MDEEAEEAEERPKRVWKLIDSIWAPRRKWSDGKDFYDNDEVIACELRLDGLPVCA